MVFSFNLAIRKRFRTAIGCAILMIHKDNRGGLVQVTGQFYILHNPIPDLRLSIQEDLNTPCVGFKIKPCDTEPFFNNLHDVIHEPKINTA